MQAKKRAKPVKFGSQLKKSLEKKAGEAEVKEAEIKAVKLDEAPKEEVKKVQQPPAEPVKQEKEEKEAVKEAPPVRDPDLVKRLHLDSNNKPAATEEKPKEEEKEKAEEKAEAKTPAPAQPEQKEPEKAAEPEQKEIEKTAEPAQKEADKAAEPATKETAAPAEAPAQETQKAETHTGENEKKDQEETKADDKATEENQAPAQTQTEETQAKDTKTDDTGGKKKSRNIFYFLGVFFITFIIGLVFMSVIFYAVQGNKNQKPKEKAVPVVDTIISTVTPTQATESKSAKLSVTPTEKAEPTAAAAEQTIKIENGSGITGEAARLKALLTDEGYTVSSVGNADKNTYLNTKIIVKKNTETAYVTKLKKVLSTKYKLDPETKSTATASDEADVTIIIGKNLVKQ